MGMNIDQWRCVIGCWAGGIGLEMKHQAYIACSKTFEEGSCATFRLLLLLLPVLLAIGCIETNPGPFPSVAEFHKQLTTSSPASSTLEVQQISDAQQVKYPKRRGCADDRGQKFEFCTAALIALRCMKQNMQFCLAANVDGIGAFDDLVLWCIDAQGNSKTFFVQLKCRDSLITTKMFTNPRENHKLGLHKYYLSYRKIRKMFKNKDQLSDGLKPVFNTEFDNCEFVIYTNAKFHAEFVKARNKYTIPQDVLSSCNNGEFNITFCKEKDKEVYDIYKDLLECKLSLESLKIELDKENREGDIVKEWKKGLAENNGKIMLEVLQEIDKLCTGKQKNITKLYAVIEEEIDCIGCESDFVKFLDKLKLHTGQPCGGHLMNEIKNVVTDIFQIPESDAEITCYFLRDDINKWWDKKYYLTDMLLKDSLQKAKINLSSVTLHKISQLTKFRLLSLDIGIRNDAINEIHTFLDKSGVLMIETDKNCKELAALKINQVMKAMGKENYVFLMLSDVLNTVNDLLEIWQDILVIMNDSGSHEVNNLFNRLVDVLRHCESRRLIIICENGDTLSTQLRKIHGKIIKLHRDTCTLTQLDELTQNKLLDEDAIFQGFEVPLKELLLDHELKEAVRGEDLAVLTHKDGIIKIGNYLVDVPCDFISRQLERNICLANTIFFSTMGHTRYVISGISEQELSELVPVDTFICRYEDLNGKIPVACECPFLLLKSSNPERAFRKLCETYENIHWIIKIGQFLVWKQSQGNIELIYPHVLPFKTPYEIKTVMDIPDRMVLLSGAPGMGKSTLLTHLSVQTKKKYPSLWVVQISLNDWTTYFDKLNPQKTEMKDLRKILEKCVGLEKGRNPLGKALFEYSFKMSGKMVLLLDGFDEISPFYCAHLQRFLEMLKNSVIAKVWVTSRPQLQTFLPKELLTIPFTISAFNEKDQELYLKKFCRKKFPEVVSKFLSRFVKSVLKVVGVSSSDKRNKFMSIPLHAMMVGEALETYFSSRNLSVPKKLDLFQLYEGFIDKKFNIFFNEKTHDDITNAAAKGRNEREKKKLYSEHTRLGLSVVFSPQLLNDLEQSSVPTENEEYLEKIGIIDCIYNEKPHFVHHTFAEYFTAVWLADNIRRLTVQKSLVLCLTENFNRLRVCRSLLLSMAFMESFDFFRNIFDRILSKGNEIHTAVLDNDLQKVKKCLDCRADINSIDKGGRTALHLAAAYGFTGIAKLLLDKKADVSIRDNVLCWRPLQYAKIGLLRKTVWFQGCKMKFRALVSGISDLSVFEVPEDVLHCLLVRKKVVIGRKLDDVLTYYMHSMCVQELFGNTVFTQKTPDTIFALSGVEEYVCGVTPFGEEIGTCNGKTAPNCRFFSLNDNPVMEFQALCKKFKNVHWFHYGKPCSRHIISQGNTEILYFNRFGIYEMHPYPLTAFELPNKIVLLVAETGMGKSTYLAHLAKQSKLMKPENWVIYLNFKKCVDIFHNFEFEDKIEAVRFIISAVNIKSSCFSWKKQRIEELLLYFIVTQTDRAVLLVDGIDELDLTNRNKAINFLTVCEGMRFRQIWITAQPYMQLNLEKEFSCLAFRLPHMKTWELIRHVWSSCNTYMHDKYSTNYRNIDHQILSPCSDITKCIFTVPLFAVMLSVIIENLLHIKVGSKFSQLNLLIVFEKYLENRLPYVNCKTTRTVILNKCNTSVEDFKSRALHYLFPTHVAQPADLKELPDIHDGLPELNHHAWVQYFGALWLTDNYKQNRDLLNCLFLPENKLLRILFDYMLAKDCDLHIAALECDLSRVRKLLSEGIDINKRDMGGRTALHLAVETHINEYVLWEMRRGNFGITNCCSSLPLEGEWQKLRSQVTSLLLEHGADIKIKDDVLQWTPVCYATRNQAWQCLNCMFELHKDVSLKINKEYAHSALIEACYFNCWNILQQLLDGKIVSVNDRLNNRNDTLLHILSLGTNSIDMLILKYLVEQGANINVRNKNGYTPLHLAVENVHLREVAQFFICKKAELNSHTNEGCTPLHLTVNLHSLNDLIVAGADINKTDKKGYTPLHAAISKSYLKSDVRDDIIHSLIQGDSNINAQTINGFSPLHLAVVYKKGEGTAISQIIKAGANVNMRTSNGDTPLHLALCYLNKHTWKIVKELIDAGADFRVTNNLGFSSLHHIIFGVNAMSSFKVNASIFTIYHSNPQPLPLVDFRHFEKSTAELLEHFKSLLLKEINSGINFKEEITKVQSLSIDNELALNFQLIDNDVSIMFKISNS